MRRSAGEAVSGSIRLSFAWDVTARSLLNLKLAALERVLAQRTEVLCMLSPTNADTALKWANEDSQQHQIQMAQPDLKEKVSWSFRVGISRCSYEGTRCFPAANANPTQCFWFSLYLLDAGLSDIISCCAFMLFPMAAFSRCQASILWFRPLCS